MKSITTKHLPTGFCARVARTVFDRLGGFTFILTNRRVLIIFLDSKWPIKSRVVGPHHPHKVKNAIFNPIRRINSNASRIEIYIGICERAKGWSRHGSRLKRSAIRMRGASIMVVILKPPSNINHYRKQLKSVINRSYNSTAGTKTKSALEIYEGK